MEKIYLATGICINIGIFYGIIRMNKLICKLEEIIDERRGDVECKMEGIEGGDVEGKMEDGVVGDEEDREGSGEVDVSGEGMESEIEERLRRVSDVSDEREGWMRYVSFGVK